jgi:hypothetical protein
VSRVANGHATTTSDMRPASVLLFALGLFALRALASGVGSFNEGDEISIASGVASIVRDVPGPMYRYGVQFGYYRLVALLTTVTGGDLTRIPIVMAWLSLVAGVVIPLCGLFAFRRDLTARERWLVAALLAANPVIWMSARYGNTAMVSVACTTVAITLLSNGPGRAGEVVALAAFAAAITLRADAVLVSGALLALLWRTHGTLVRAALRLAPVGVAIAALLLVLRANDPYMASVGDALASHVANPIKTHFFEFLVWALSPFPLFFAAAGLRESQRLRPALFLTLLAWIGPPFAFYFTNTTTPRYLLQGVVPLTLAGAIGMWSFVEAGTLRRLATSAVVFLLGFVHLFIGLSEFSPAKPRSFLKDAEIPSDDGRVWTGALLYKTYVRNPLEPGRLLQTRFRPGAAGEMSFAAMFDTLAGGSRRGARVTIVNAGGYGNTMHFFANLAGAAPVASAPCATYDASCQLALGGTTVDVAGLAALRGTDTRVDLRPGDEVWIVARDSASGIAGLAPHVPAGVALDPQPSWRTAPRLTRFMARGAS